MTPLICWAAVVLAGFGACGDDGGPNDPGDSNSNPIDTIPPSAITDLAVYQKLPESITIVWTAPGDDGDVGKAQRYDIRYSDEPITEQSWETAVQTADEPRPKEAGLMQMMLVDGLEPSTDYHFAMKAFDEASNASALSNCLSCNTMPEDDPPAGILDLNTITIDETSYMLIWTAPGDDGYEGQASEYDIRYAEGAFGDFDWEAATRVTEPHFPKSPGELDTVVVSGLRSDVNYKFALKTGDEVPNWSEISNVGRALMHGVFLAISKSSIPVGETLTIVYKSTVDKKLGLRFQWWPPEDCNIPQYGYRLTLDSGWYPTGTKTLVYDFYNEETDEYWPINGWALLCWGSEYKGREGFALRFTTE